jgi:1-aminocyclopropane-1-carboxylate deaminase/D-cysteine desulfhydrase-like pyridoxal-dependent ACC family enzyme
MVVGPAVLAVGATTVAGLAVASMLLVPTVIGITAAQFIPDEKKKKLRTRAEIEYDHRHSSSKGKNRARSSANAK